MRRSEPRCIPSSSAAAKTKGTARQCPKSSAIVEDSSDADAMDVNKDESEEEEEKQQTKRARVGKSEFNFGFFLFVTYSFSGFKSEHNKHLTVLEERVKTLDKVMDKTSRNTQRLDSLEGTV